MGGQHGIVRFDNGSRHLRSWVNGEFQLGLFAVVNGQLLQKQGAQTRTGTTTQRVSEEETLQTLTLVRHSSDAVQHVVQDLSAHCVVATSVVVRRIFFTGNQLLWVKQILVGARTNLVYHVWLQIHVQCSRHVLARACFGEKSRESLFATFRSVQSFLKVSIWSDPVFLGV
uniref:Uncharacterized protein n=1 Tax=Candidozyma auris TaxID=498019 RepID=A0A0L0NZ90_CANAR